MKASDIGRAIRDVFRCPTCGKSRLLANTAGYRRPVSIERFDPEKHCSCPPPKFNDDVCDECGQGPRDQVASEHASCCGWFSDPDEP